MEPAVERRNTRRSPDEEFTLETLKLLQSCGASIRESDRAAIERARDGQAGRSDVRQGGDRRSGERRSPPTGADDPAS